MTNNNILKQQNIIYMMFGLLLIAALVMPQEALAGTSGTEFDNLWTTLKGWVQGTLGRIIAGAMILVGIIAGIARQSLMAFAIGIGGGMGLYQSPAIVEAILTATLPHADKVAPIATAISNGLGS